MKILSNLAKIWPPRTIFWEILMLNASMILILKLRESYSFNPDFPDLGRFKDIEIYHGSVLFQPFDHEGLRI